MKAIFLLLPLFLLGCSSSSDPSEKFINEVFSGQEPKRVCEGVSPDWKAEKEGKALGGSCREIVTSLQADYIPRALSIRLVSPGRSVAVVCYKKASGYSILILLLQEQAGEIKDLQVSPNDLLPGERRAAERARSRLPESCRDIPLL